MSRPSKPFKAHDRVFHRKLEADGVVLEVLANGRLRVGIGSLSVECAAADLVSRKDGPTAHTKQRGEALKSPPARAAKTPGRSSSVDLHGMTVDEALPTVASAIDRAILSGADSLEVIHGHGTGKLKSAVHRYLKTISVVKHFKLDEKNSGTTLVYF